MFDFRARIEALESKIQRALASALAAATAGAAAAAALAGITRIQTGTVNLIGGTFTVVTATITAQSRIIVQFATSNGGNGAAEPFTTKLETPARVPGAPGSFEIAALTNNGLLDATNTSSVDWVVFN